MMWICSFFVTLEEEGLWIISWWLLTSTIFHIYKSMKDSFGIKKKSKIKKKWIKIRICFYYCDIYFMFSVDSWNPSRYPLAREGVYAPGGPPFLAHARQRVSNIVGLTALTASIFYGIWITQSGAMVFILNLDNILLKKLFPTMNI